MLKLTEVDLELLSDYNMLMMVEKGIQGGISMITTRYAKADNKYIKKYQSNRQADYIAYLVLSLCDNLHLWHFSLVVLCVCYLLHFWYFAFLVFESSSNPYSKLGLYYLFRRQQLIRLGYVQEASHSRFQMDD